MERIDSDIPNSDSVLVVQFFAGAIRNNFMSEQEGREIWDDVDFIRIFTPGDSKNIIERPVHEEDKRRFPIHWKAYENQKGGDGISGTPLAEWPRVSRAQVEQLKSLKFYTVESIAGASDQQIQSIGMTVGMSPFAFRDHARRFLELAASDAISAKEAERINALAKENEETKRELAEMKQLLASLTAPAAEKADKKK